MGATRMSNVELVAGACLAVTAALPVPDALLAYVGPGAGLSAIGALLAIIAGLAVAVGDFVWYPVKRLLRRRKRQSD